MAEHDNDRLRRIFDLVVATAPAARAAILDRECGGDAALRERIESMVAGAEDVRFLAEPTADLGDPPPGLEPEAGRTARPAAEGPGTRIGPYRLLEQIGEGGFGTVFVAEQQEPVERRVALKIIKPGMDSRQIVARFEQERQALALMDHSNIARVLDGGTTDAGRPYFVMDLVKGVPIVEYCDRHTLRIDERLAIFVQVCMAVQHAHTKGIIHRDIKPSNVLVSTLDGRPIAKVIDFGIAKATERKLTEKTLFTEHHQLIGTPEYMSPEQAEGSLDIDTRSDVYALGVLLYELVTGTTPFSRKELRSAAYAEIQRIIREVEPPRPSTRLSEAGDSLSSVAAQRHVEPRRLSALIRGELDWIVMKPLEKDRERRYQTARGFARDIERYLSGDAVEARPPSAGYRLQKFLRRNRGPVAAGLLVLVVLVAGIVGTTWGLVAAKDQARIATARLGRLEKGVEILGSIFVDLDPMAKEHDGSLSAALASQLDRAVDELQGEAIGDPLVVAGMQEKLGMSLAGLGRSDKAVDVLESVVAVRRSELGDEDPDTLRGIGLLAAACAANGDVARAQTLFEEALPVLTEALPADDPLVLKHRAEYAFVLVQLGHFDEALAEYAAVLKTYGAAGRLDEPTALRTAGKLATAHLEQQDFKRAVPLLEDLLPRCETVFGADHPNTLAVRNDLAMGYQQAGDYMQCVPLLQEVHEAFITRLGVDHPRTLESHHNVAHAKRMAGEIHEAVPIFERLVESYETRLGSTHISTIKTKSELGAAYTSLGRYEESLAIIEECIAAAPPLSGTDDPWGPMLRMDYAYVLNRTGSSDAALETYETVLPMYAGTLLGRAPAMLKARFQWAETLSETNAYPRAIEIARAALDLAVPHLGADHPVTMYGRNALAYSYRYAGELENALPLLEGNLGSMARQLGDEHPQTIITRINFASAARDAGDLPRALELMETGIEQSERTNGPRHPTTIAIREIWCDTLDEAEDWERSIAERAFHATLAREGDDAPKLAMRLYFQGRTLLAAGRADEAEAPLREAVAIQLEKVPDKWLAYNTQSLLGGTLLALGRHAEAEPVLLAGHAGLQERADQIGRPNRKFMLHAIERLVELYDATERPTEAARWRAELEKAEAAGGAGS